MIANYFIWSIILCPSLIVIVVSISLFDHLLLNYCAKWNIAGIILWSPLQKFLILSWSSRKNNRLCVCEVKHTNSSFCMDLAKTMTTMGNYYCCFANIFKIFSTEKLKWFVSKYKWCVWSPLQRFLIYQLSCSGEKHGGVRQILFQKLQSCYLLQIHKNHIGDIMVNRLKCGRLWAWSPVRSNQRH